MQCAGVRFLIAKLVELAYLDAALSSTNSTTEGSLISDTTKFSLDKHGIDVLRTSLAHPFNLMQSTVRCVVTGINVLDGADSEERLIVASRLWVEGISAEYMAQSGVISSLIKENRGELQGTGTSVSHCGFCLVFRCFNCQLDSIINMIFVGRFARDGPSKMCVVFVLY
jgi:hypothetical protein